MSLVPETILSPAAENDYCLDLRQSFEYLLAGFSSNTIKIYSTLDLSSATIMASSEGMLSEACPIDENTVACCFRAGGISLYDIRSLSQVLNIPCNEEIYSIDASGSAVVTGSNKGLSIWDLRTQALNRSITEMFADGFDITSVRIRNSCIASCCEDSILSVYKADSTEEDDYTLLNIGEPGLKVGFNEENVWCCTINKYIEYSVHIENEEIPPQEVQQLSLADLQGFGTNSNYLIKAYGTGGQSMVASGSHE